MKDANPTTLCPRCGSPNDADARYCLSCGAPAGQAAQPTVRHAAPSPYPPPSRQELVPPEGHALRGGPVTHAGQQTHAVDAPRGHALGTYATHPRPLAGVFERARPVFFFLLLALIGVLLYLLLFR